MKKTLVAALLAASTLLPSRLHAFDYAAHCRISNRALRIAALHMERTGALDAIVRDSLRALRANTTPATCQEKNRIRTFAYGEWVAQVDWAVSPTDFFVTPVAKGMQRWTEVDSVPADAIWRVANVPLQDLRVLHENGEHFGAPALYSFRLWHTHAIQEARRGRLNVALVYQAFADHYLQDLFAPGHIFSPRKGLNDVLAGGIHNRYNRRGAYYTPARTSELAVYAADFSAAGDLLSPRLDSLERSACRRAAPGAGLDECIRALEHDTIAMYGDYQLERSAAQELLLTLVVARSVHDVLQGWAARDARTPDSFEGSRWCGYRVEETGGSLRPWTSPNAVIPFGRFLQEERRGLPLYEPWPTVRAGYVNRVGEEGGVVEVSAERMTRAWPGAWTGAPSTRGISPFREDRATYLGVDLRVPVDEGHGPAVGGYVRRSASLNRINVRTSYTLGARLLPLDASVEPHAGAGMELGFSLVHFELRPSVAFNTRHGVEAGVLTGFNFVIPGRGKGRPPAGHPPTPPEARR